ncbi:MAG: MipA/OmpV family protein [Bdellovibrionales bacterium]|nr:MipA/OmpV family protein [Bdellovibrionales bacterium]
MLYFFFYLLFIFPEASRSEILNLIDLPLGDETFFSYSVNLPNDCSFHGVQKIEISNFDSVKKKNFILDKINSVQKKLNFSIDEEEIDDDRIVFSLKGSTNLSFEFFLKKSETTPSCNLVKVAHINDKKFNMDHIEIEYKSALFSPVIQKIIIKDENNQDSDIYIYPWQLRGQISVYELNIGPAVNIHSNIRYKNKNLFEKDDPAMAPVPAFFFRYGPFFINKNGMGSLLYHKEDFSLLGMGLLEGEPYKNAGLKEREQGIFAGFIAKYNNLELTYYNAFFDEKGYNLKLNLAPEFYYRISWKITPQLFVQYWDNNYVDYYFGVTSEETVSSLKSYKGSHTINYGGMLEIMHFVKKWTILGSAGVKVYGKEVQSSPTVVKKNELRLILSVLYKVF